MGTSLFRKFLHRIIITSLLILLIKTPSVTATEYILTDLGSSNVESIAYGINESCQVVGWSGDQTVLWENGTMNILGSGLAYDINESGKAVGEQNGSVLWENSTTVNLNAPGGSRSWSSGINNLGQVSIYSPTADNGTAPYHAYVWDPDLGIIVTCPQFLYHLLS
jgi:uncharacterized membrane protein